MGTALLEWIKRDSLFDHPSMISVLTRAFGGTTEITAGFYLSESTPEGIVTPRTLYAITPSHLLWCQADFVDDGGRSHFVMQTRSYRLSDIVGLEMKDKAYQYRAAHDSEDSSVRILFATSSGVDPIDLPSQTSRGFPISGLEDFLRVLRESIGLGA